VIERQGGRAAVLFESGTALSDADRMDNADCYGCLVQGIVSP